jgi:2-polyprenyl-3-methyl-5-hydroxy-6-metoxy-1,4-benzoquinol methylase
VPMRVAVKNSWTFDEQVVQRFSRMIGFDRAEIDNPDQYNHVVLHYLDRLRTINEIITREFPDRANTKVGEFGCAQGNIAILLADQGYKLWAVDRGEDWIEYAKLKDTEQKVTWLAGDLRDLPLALESLDVIILGEVITLTDRPELMIERAARFLRVGGMMIVSIPNGDRVSMNLARWSDILRQRDSASAHESDSHHLYKIPQGEFSSIVPGKMQLTEWVYCGSSVIWNGHTTGLLRPFPLSFARWSARVSVRIPIVNRWFARSCCFILRKVVAEQA